MRRDLMRPGVHYGPSQTQPPTAEKSSALLLFASAAAHGWRIENMDISNAYVRETAIYQPAKLVR